MRGLRCIGKARPESNVPFCDKTGDGVVAVARRAGTQHGSENVAAEKVEELAASEGTPCLKDDKPSFIRNESADLKSDVVRTTSTVNTELGCFCPDTFPGFKDLLIASEDYARFSGCRFCADDFDVLSPLCPEATSEKCMTRKETSATCDPSLEAKLKAAPVVHGFGDRLKAGDPALLVEIEKAHRLIMMECLRNAMMSSCQRLEVWPPKLPPASVNSNDCDYEDTSAPFLEIAQRLYNDEMRRQRHSVGVSKECPWSQRAMTASFLIDFASENTVALPRLHSSLTLMHARFEKLACDWEDEHGVKCGFMQNPSYDSAYGPIKSSSKRRLRQSFDRFVRVWIRQRQRPRRSARCFSFRRGFAGTLEDNNDIFRNA
eukprot:TRINITY_DN54543_c0_g1_i1.p1 TRINITY_DN54543_c0_g1~~TRINITY_DN54543_c0_g1_i1.p1  ORF type:complete len:375 (+),score=39.96 TRINITY_DN54543_c0_g1_i1:187-1311(+)